MIVSGPRFISTDNVTCIFDGEEVNGIVLGDENAVLCTTPRLRRTGRIPVMIRHNQILLERKAYFYSGKNACMHAHSIPVVTMKSSTMSSTILGGFVIIFYVTSLHILANYNV